MAQKLLARKNESYSGAMRGGLERWKRGVGSRGIGQAIDYALKGTCDAHLHPSTGSDALEMYSAAADARVTRFSPGSSMCAIQALMRSDGDTSAGC